MQVVWFKRDLRIHDNEALAQAVKAGTVLPLYIVEPDLWAQPDMSHRQYQFMRECLIELFHELRDIGQGLIIKVGDAVEILQQLHETHDIDAIWSHQETWSGWTYGRDLRVKDWTKKTGITWHEPLQFGVIRRLQSRNSWSTQWQSLMSIPQYSAPTQLVAINECSEKCPTAEEIGLQEDDCPQRQLGGRTLGLSVLESFFGYRGEGYTKEMSSPVTAFNSCSRLSPYLAFGILSLREVIHACAVSAEAHDQCPYGTKSKWGSALRSFSGRLHWHCHFMQKLEDQPSIEFRNLHYGYDGLRENDFNHDFFKAWQTGHTGYPMIDACMRALISTGWLNFRMRAMLMSFATYHLWLHWREPALHLARLFTDYEPGIHYSQAQMQSGTTGINSIRVYNPIKQGIDQDPDGVFIKHWIPELADIPAAFIHTPWICSDLMKGYPMPIIEEKTARKKATEKLYTVKKSLENRQIAQGIVEKHGSRKSRGKKKKKEIDNRQGELPF